MKSNLQNRGALNIFSKLIESVPLFTLLRLGGVFEFFKSIFFPSGLWQRGRLGVLHLITLPLLLCCFQHAFATPTTPTSDFIDNKNGTVTHKTAGLTWMRCAIGQTWTGSTCSGTVKTFAYAQAIALTRTFAGHSDWRLPNIAELNTIVERAKFNPAVNTSVFPNATNMGFWSSSSSAYNGEHAWIIEKDGGGAPAWKNLVFAVRLVRGGQFYDSLPLTTPSKDFIDNQNGTVTHKRRG